MTESQPRPAAAPVSKRSRRRLWTAAGVAGFAGLAGVGAAVWRFPGGTERPVGEEGGSSNGLGATNSDLWLATFDQPDGGQFQMSSFQGRWLVLNFWATWCPPCVEEMPELDRFFAQHRPNGWQVLGLAIDQPSAVRTFLARLPVSFPIGLAGLAGTDLMRRMGNSAGGLPFTVLMRPSGDIAERKIGKTNLAELKRWAAHHTA